MQLPEDIANRALDALGLSDLVIGSIQGDGTSESESVRRIYGPTLRQLLSAAHWAFARKHAPLQLLGDRLGGTLAPNGQPISNAVEPPWRFAYAWPIDGVRARWLPWCGVPPNAPGAPSGNIAGPTAPPLTNINTAAGPWIGEVPARFMLSTSDQFPILSGQGIPPDTGDVEGVGILSRRIVLTDVPMARFVYTLLVLEPDIWDALFAEAMVATLAARLAVSLLVDKNATGDERAKQRQMAVGVRNAQMTIAVNAVREARVASANEAGFPQSTDKTPDWIRARFLGGSMWSQGSRYGGGDGMSGYFWVGWDTSIF